MSAKTTIFQKIRSATEGLEENTPLPSSADIFAVRSNLVPSNTEVDTLVDAFCARFAEANGKPLRSWEELQSFLEAEGATHIYADPKAVEAMGQSDPRFVDRYERAEVDTINCGITLASMGIAETGTIVLKDEDTRNRLAALAPWVHVAVLRKETLVDSLITAMGKLGKDPSIVFVTGPSKTADIEGILIEGVHGPGVQGCLIV